MQRGLKGRSRVVYAEAGTALGHQLLFGLLDRLSLTVGHLLLILTGQIVLPNVFGVVLVRADFAPISNIICGTVE